MGPAMGTRKLVWVLAGLALALTFWAYQNPHLALEVANGVWACF
jgi:hypothetical protein